MDAEAHSVSIKDRLLKERHALLDLSTRNRLLNTPLRTRNNRAIEIVDEKANEVLRLLVAGKSLSFLPGTDLTEEERAALDLILPLLSGPERILALGLKEAHHGQEETHGRGDYRQAA